MMQEEELYRYQTEALAESIVKNKDNYCTKIQIKIHQKYIDILNLVSKEYSLQKQNQNEK